MSLTGELTIEFLTDCDRTHYNHVRIHYFDGSFCQNILFFCYSNYSKSTFAVFRQNILLASKISVKFSNLLTDYLRIKKCC